jgi:hypothetical protein
VLWSSYFSGNIRGRLTRKKKTMGDTDFVGAIPVLASLDIERSVDFFASRLGFTVRYSSQREFFEPLGAA